MNQITIEGKIVNNAKKILIKSRNSEIPMTVFQVCDSGMPFQKNEANLYIEIHCLKEYMNNMFDQLVSNKHVLVTGYLQQKKFRDEVGNQKSIYYITADNIKFLDKPNNTGDSNGKLS